MSALPLTTGRIQDPTPGLPGREQHHVRARYVPDEGSATVKRGASGTGARRLAAQIRHVLHVAQARSPAGSVPGTPLPHASGTQSTKHRGGPANRLQGRRGVQTPQGESSARLQELPNGPQGLGVSPPPAPWEQPDTSAAAVADTPAHTSAGR